MSFTDFEDDTAVVEITIPKNIHPAYNPENFVFYQDTVLCLACDDGHHSICYGGLCQTRGDDE